MPQDQIGDLQAFCQLTGFFYGAVVLLVRREAVTVFIEAEGLAEEPLAAGYVFFSVRIIRLVAGTGKLLSVLQIHGESELLCLGRMNIKEGYAAS